MLSIPHIIVIFVVALIVFGPEKLPELARNLGKVMAEFRRHTSDLRTTFEGHLRDIEREGDARRIAATSPAPAASAATPVTVPSDPPNAAAVSPAPSDPAPPDPPAESQPQRELSMDDPTLAFMDEPYHKRQPPEPEQNPQPVSDGDTLPS